MKPKSNKQRNYDLDDVAVMDLSSEFGAETFGKDDFDYIDLDAKAEVDYDEDEQFY